MSKAVKFITTSPVELIVGAVFGKKAGKAVAGIGQIALGLATGNPYFVTMGLGNVSAGLQKKPKASSNATGRLTATLDPNAPRKIVLGHTAMATDVIYQTFTGTNQEYYHQILCVASHQVGAIDQIWLDSELAWSAGSAQGKYVGYLTAAPKLVGTTGGGIPIDAGWTANHSLTGCAYLHIRYKLTGNSKKAESPFAQSIPTRVTIRGKGALVPDIRVGGVSATNQATWTFGTDAGRNPALQLLFYLLGWKINGKLAVGRGIPAERIDLQSFLVAANICDEPVALSAGGTEPRYRTDGVFSEGDDPGTVISNLEAAMSGRLRDAGGKISLIIFKNDLAVPVMSFTEADIIGDDSWRQTPPVDEAFNLVRGRYVDPSNTALYQLAEYPEISIPSVDGIERIDNFDLLVVQSASQAQRLAKTRLQRRQYGGVFSASFNAKGWAVTLGDIVSLSHSALGFNGKLFRVTRHNLAMSGVVALELAEEHSDIYAWAASDAPAVVAQAPTVYDPLNAPTLVTEGADIGVENGADVTSAIVGTPEIVIKADSGGTPLAGELPRTSAFKLIRNGVDLTTSATWTRTLISGNVTSFIGATTGVVSVTAIGALESVVRLTATQGGNVRTMDIKINQSNAPAPTSGSTSGGSTGGTASTQTVSGAYDSTAWTVISSEAVVAVGSAGTVTLTAGTIVHAPQRDTPSGDWTVEQQWQWFNGSAWVALGAPDSDTTQVLYEPEVAYYFTQDGSISSNLTHTNTAGATGQRYRLTARVAVGGTKLHFASGSCNAQG